MDAVKAKTCTKCKTEKPLSDFYYRAHRNQYEPSCKLCCNAYVRKWRERFPEKVKKVVADYAKNNRDKYRDYQNGYYHKNKEKLIPAKKATREKHKHKWNETAKKYRQTDDAMKKRKIYMDKYRASEEYFQRVRDYHYKRKDSDPQYVIRRRLRGRLRVALTRIGRNKNVSLSAILGCDSVFLKEYFESKFTEGMSWERFLAGEIHIDHKIPCKNFDLTKDDEVNKCFHYSNIQPLWKVDNLKKGAKLDYVLQG